jgi:hypothetical protein
MRYSILLAAAAAVLLSSCVTRPKIYKAPDPTRVIETTKRLSAAIDRANATTARAETKLQEAQASEDRVAGHSASVLQLLRELKPNIPAELMPKFVELENSADAQIAEEGILSTATAGARGEVAQLKQDQAGIVKEKGQLMVDQATHFIEDRQLAAAATYERNARIAAEKKLVQQKIFRILWTVGGSFAALLVVVAIGLAICGKLGWGLAKIGIKTAL